MFGKYGLYFKILFLVAALIGTFFAMKNLNPEKVQTAFQALGIEPGAPGQPGLQPGGAPLAQGEIRRSLCLTRIHAIRFPDGKALVEVKKGMKLDWTAEESGKSRSVGYLDIEKWLSRHCQFVAKPVSAAEEPDLVPQNEPKPYVIIEFIDKSRWEIHRSGEVLFTVSDPTDRFLSPDLDSALEELKVLAGLTVDSSGQ
jgi:hypothetical protein